LGVSDSAFDFLPYGGGSGDGGVEDFPHELAKM
jgi:hypothetical protein